MAQKVASAGDARNELHARVKKELVDCKNRTMGRMVKEHLSGPTGPSSVRARSNRLRSGLNGAVATFGNKMTMFMYFGGGVPYARIHEYGGTVLPKRAKNLAVPVGAAVNKSGVSRASGPTAVWAMLKFIVNKKTGKKLLVKQGRGKKLEVWFVLVPSITLPPRLNFGKTFQEEAEKTVQRVRAIRVEGTGIK